MTEKRTSYLYVHRYATGDKKGCIFYVGKGTKSRMYSKNSRNTHWHNINSKHGMVAEKIVDNITPNDALELEMLLIRQIGIENLANKSMGGEIGNYGNPISPSHKRKISLFMKNYWKTEPLKKGWKHPCQGRVLSESTRKKISDAAKANWMNESIRKKTTLGIRKYASSDEAYKRASERNSGKNNPAFDHKIRTFIHKDGTVFTGTRFDLYSSFKVSKCNLPALIRGERLTVNGWRIK